MRVPVLVAGLLLACPVAAEAAVVLINNGLDCSNPGNVIDHVTYQSDTVVVRNVGCGTPDPGSPCSSPGDATEVCVEVGGDVYELYAYDSSAVTMNGGTVGEYMVARGSSAIELMGTGFAVDGSRVPYGDLSAQTGTLTGRLASGDPMDNWFNQGGGDYTGTITLTRALPAIRVPALSLSGKLLLAAALLGFGVVHRRRPRAA